MTYSRLRVSLSVHVAAVDKGARLAEFSLRIAQKHKKHDT